MHKTNLTVLGAALALILTGGCEKESKVVKKDPDPSAQTPAPPAPTAAVPKSPHGGAANPHAGANPHGGGAPHAGGQGMGMTAPKVAMPTAADGTKVMGAFSMKVPKAWRESTPTSTMRAAQFKMGDAGAEAELVVYYFGKGGAGGKQANLDRWYSQFSQADGSASKDKAKTAEKNISGFAVTTTDLTGRYVAAVRPGAAQKHDKAGQRMLAAIVESPTGPYYFKLIGPAKTVAKAKKDFDGFVASIKKADGAAAPAGKPAAKKGAAPKKGDAPKKDGKKDGDGW